MPTFSQVAYRWRNDDGSETTATWAAALNTQIAGVLDHNYRIRLATSLDNGDISVAPKLQYNKNSAGWNDVSGSSSVSRSQDSPTVTDGVATTAQLVGSISPGHFDDVNGATEVATPLSDAGETETEHEFCIRVRSADVTAGDQIQFRLVTSSGSAYGSYGVIGLFVVPGSYDKGQFFSMFD